MQRNHELDISFIIPVYGAEEYFPRCLDSIIASAKASGAKDSLKFEVILVEDCSPDGSAAICDEYAVKHEFITALHNEKNLGISGSRNRAMDIARGQWISFIDNDDLLDIRAMELFAANMDPAYDLIYFGADEFVGEPEACSAEPQLRELDAEGIVHLQRDMLNRFKDNDLILSDRFSIPPWGKLYNRDLLEDNKIRFFEDIRRGEDIAFNMIVLSLCKKVKIIDYPSYHWRQLPGSDSHRYKADIEEISLESLGFYRSVIRDYYNDDPEMIELYKARVLFDLLNIVAFGGVAHPKSPLSYRQKRKLLNEILARDCFAEAIKRDDFIRRFKTQHRILAILTKHKLVGTMSLMLKVRAWLQAKKG